MKKITILILAIFFGFEMQSQVAISKNPYYSKSSKFEMERFDEFKNTKTIFVLNNLYDKKQYEDMLKSFWTITQYEVVNLKDFKYQDYLSDKYSFCVMSGFTNIQTEGIRTIFSINLFILDMEKVSKKIKDLKDNDYFTFLDDKKKNLAYIELIPNDKIWDLIDRNSTTTNATGRDFHSYSYFKSKKSKYEQMVSDKIHNENVFHNYNLVMLKNNFQNVQKLLSNKAFCGFYEESVSSEIKQLKKQTLYLPEHLKKEYHTKPIEYKEYSKEKLDKILSPYPYKIEFISEKELETKILNNEEFYYLNFGYHLRYFQIVNSKTGDVIYKVYPNGMMKANLKESDFKDLVKAINKQK